MPASTVKGMRCRECGRDYPVAARVVCEYCFGPVEIVYDYEAIRRAATRQAIEAGPRSIWRYGPLLPVPPEFVVTREEGFTPLVRAERLGKQLGLDRLYVKNDAGNPTYSFKDRVVSVAISRAREFGYDTVCCPSTGNLAGSVAAYAAAAGMRAVIFVPHDLEPSKIAGAAIYGPKLVAVRGSYDDVNRLCSELANTRKWGFVNINLRPFYAEGSKTLGYEVAEQLGWKAPDAVVVPIASGSLLAKIKKGLDEFHKLALIPEPKTRFFGAQGAGCAPVITALREGATRIRPVKPNTIAKSIAIGNPADGYYALDVMRGTGGGGEDGTDEEVLAGIELLARTEGIYTETAGGAVIAALQKLAVQGKIRRDDLTIVYITGNGLKTQESLAGRWPQPPVIEAKVSEVDRVLG